MIGFVIGAVSGAVAMAYWRRNLIKVRDDQAPRLRMAAADRIESLEGVVVGMLDRVSNGARTGLRSAGRALRGQSATGASTGSSRVNSVEEEHLSRQTPPTITPRSR